MYEGRVTVCTLRNYLLLLYKVVGENGNRRSFHYKQSERQSRTLGPINAGRNGLLTTHFHLLIKGLADLSEESMEHYVVYLLDYLH